MRLTFFGGKRPQVVEEKDGWLRVWLPAAAFGAESFWVQARDDAEGVRCKYSSNPHRSSISRGVAERSLVVTGVRCPAVAPAQAATQLMAATGLQML